jgi:hypothetical protein
MAHSRLYVAGAAAAAAGGLACCLAKAAPAEREVFVGFGRSVASYRS